MVSIGKMSNEEFSDYMSGIRKSARKAKRKKILSSLKPKVKYVDKKKLSSNKRKIVKRSVGSKKPPLLDKKPRKSSKPYRSIVSGRVLK